MARITTLKDAHECIGAILVLGDFLLDIGKGSAMPNLGDVAQTTEETFLHLQFFAIIIPHSILGNEAYWKNCDYKKRLSGLQCWRQVTTATAK